LFELEIIPKGFSKVSQSADLKIHLLVVTQVGSAMISTFQPPIFSCQAEGYVAKLPLG
jgi:hypothetical protein